MKKNLIPLTVVATCALALGACSDRRESDDVVRAQDNAARETNEALTDARDATQDAFRDAKNATSNAFADAQRNIEEGWNNLKNATFDERATVRSNLSNMASELDSELAELRQDGRELSADSRERIAEAREEFNEKLNDLQNATANNWEEAKREAGEAWSELRVAVQETKQELQAAE